MNNTFGVYINPVTWVNRHRLHHRYSDHAGDPNKLASDGFWRTMGLCVLPYKSQANVANDEIFKSWPFRLVSNDVFAVAAQVFNFWLLWLLVGDFAFAAAMWILFRVFALWINMIQNYWTHDRRFGYRRYDDERDNAMNIGEWLPVTITFSACLQNNHHHSPGAAAPEPRRIRVRLRLPGRQGHEGAGPGEGDRARARNCPPDVPLTSLNF